MRIIRPRQKVSKSPREEKGKSKDEAKGKKVFSSNREEKVGAALREKRLGSKEWKTGRL